jgi:uncharacterized delta-60 repeat protein
VDSQGRILAAGYKDDTQFALARFTSSGVLDSAFASGGKQVLTDTKYGIARDVLASSDGKILVGSRGTNYYAGDNPVLVLTRFNEDGSLDLTYAGIGRAGAPISPYKDYYAKGSSSDFSKMAFQADGQVVVTGTYSYAPSAVSSQSYQEMLVARFLK